MSTAEVVVTFLDEQNKWNDSSSIEDAAAQIEAKRGLNVLELRGNTLGVEAGERLARALERHSDLKRCLWSDLFTGRLKQEIPVILKSLCASISNAGARLTELDLSDNALGPIGTEGIKDFLASSAATSLEVLKLNNCGLGGGGGVIAESLSHCHEIALKEGKKLNLRIFIAGRNRLEDPNAKLLATTFAKLRSLEEFAVPQCGIRPAGIAALAEALKLNKNLRIINLNDNTCSVQGSCAIADAIGSLENLEVLDLGDCLCRDEGSMAVVTNLTNLPNSKLKELNFTGNELTPVAIKFAIGTWQEIDFKARLQLGTNCLGSQFGAVQQLIDNYDNIDLGNEDDDEGSAEEDDENNEESDDSSNCAADGEDTDNANVCNKALDLSKPKETSSGVLSFLDGQARWDTADSVSSVIKKISESPEMHTLELRGNTLGTEAGSRIADVLKKAHKLKRCLWSDLFTGRLRTEIPPVVQGMCGALMAANAAITELDLSDNAFGPIGGESIKAFLESPSAFTLEVLKLNNCGLGAGGKIVADALIACHANGSLSGKPLKLKTFIAGRNRLENPGAMALANAFHVIGTLEEVRLYQNGIQRAGIQALFQAFKCNPNLRIVDVSDNTATELGAVSISKALPALQKLEILNLSDCLCRDAGCRYIVEALQPNVHTDLKDLDLSGSEMSPDAAVDIAKTMGAFDGRVHVKLSANNFGHKFKELSETKPLFVDLGVSSDDQGSLSDYDDEELNSNSGSDADESMEVPSASAKSPQNTEKENVRPMVFGTRHISPRTMQAFHAAETALKEIGSSYESRFQTETAIFFMRIANLLAHFPLDAALKTKAYNMTEEVVKRVEAQRRMPIPPSTQLINNLFAQLGCVKSEGPLLPQGVNRDCLIALIEEMARRGHFKKETATIMFYKNQLCSAPKICEPTTHTATNRPPFVFGNQAQ